MDEQTSIQSPPEIEHRLVPWGMRFLLNMLTLFYWGMFGGLAFVSIVQSIISSGLVDGAMLGNVIGEMMAIFFAPYQGIVVLVTHESLALKGGALDVVGALGTWSTILGIPWLVYRKFFPRPSTEIAEGADIRFKKTRKRALLFFAVCVFLGLVARNFQGVMIYTIFNLMVYPLSYSVLWNYRYAQRL
jgi:hypothetical protein